MKMTIKTEEAVKTLLSWIGDDPTRKGLQKTPSRVAERYKEIFCGYDVDLEAILKKPTIPVTKEIGIGMVLIPGIKFFSFCEHHLLPMIGEIYIAYLPAKKLSGIGTIIKIANAFSRRLQIQEKLTEQIAETIEKYLQPAGVSVAIKAEHYCVDRKETGSISEQLHTYNFLGTFKADKELQSQFMIAISTKQ
jgi:GTP cyclohydrolase I